MIAELQDIPQYPFWQSIQPIAKGYSADRKYKIQQHDGTFLLVRTADCTFYEEKALEFQYLCRVQSLQLPTPQPIALGTCHNDQRVYTILSWEEGEDLESCLPSFTSAAQYHLGVQAGALLHRLHTVAAPSDQLPWREKYLRRVHGITNKYQQSDFTLPGEDVLLHWLETHDHLISDVPQVLLHGDFHTGNLVLDASAHLHIIDFNRFDFGAPWQEFNRLIWSAPISPWFACGQIHGYFSNHVPDSFFPLLKFYLAVSAICSTVWAYGSDAFASALSNSLFLLEAYNGLEAEIPNWYHTPQHIQNAFDSH